jgi:KDO2-lipid IV(A) lauroyltransferase
VSSAAATELRKETPAPLPQVEPAGHRLRQRAANFWLDLLFRCAGRPTITRLMKPLVVSLGFSCSKKLQAATAFNAQRIFSPGLTPAQCRAFGRRVLGNFYDFVCDVGLSQRLSMSRLLSRIESVQGHPNYAAARAMKKGAIIATAHMGSFEIGAAALLQHDQRIHVVFKRDPSRFEQVRSALRQKLGILEAPVDEGLGLWVRLRDVLMRDEVVMVQSDRVMPGQKGATVPFLHGQVMLPTGPVKLALASGAPIVPVFAVRVPDGRIRICVEEAIIVEPSEQSPHPAMLKLAAVIERYVRQYPDQWLMFDRAFRDE